MPDEDGQSPGAEEQAFFAQDGGADEDPMGIGQRRAERVRSRGTRRLAMLGVFAVFIGLASWMLADELAYFFSSRQPVELGRAEEMQVAALGHNRYVRITGIARDMCIRADVLGDSVRFLFLMGSQMGARILIEAPALEQEGCQGAVQGEFRGRLLNLARTDRYDAVLAYYRENFPVAPAQGPVYMLQQGRRPGDGWIYPAVLGLLLALAGVNFALLLRARRRRAATGNS